MTFRHRAPVLFIFCWPGGCRRQTRLVTIYGEVLPYADIGQSLKCAPEVQVAGSEVRLVCALASLEHGPPGRSRNIKAPLPVPRIAIQYLAPVTIAAEGGITVLKAPGVNALELTWDSSVPGWPALSVYTPITMLLPVELASMNTDIAPNAPLATAVVWKASAVPAGLESRWLSVAVSPNRRTDGAATVSVTATVAGEFCTPAAPVTVM